jgi:hypothetical protein
MKIDILLNYSENDNIQMKVVEKTRTHISGSINFFLESCRLLNNVEKKWFSQMGCRVYNMTQKICDLQAG